MPLQAQPSQHLIFFKLSIPPLSAVIARPQLLSKLESGSPHALTLISAPPGYGKTTLVVDWLNRSKRRFVWLSLDPADNDPVRFFTYLIAALRQIDADIGTATASLINLPQFPPVETVVTGLINDLTASATEFALVLDDYHVIRTPLLHQAVEFLIERHPPNVRLVLTTREDPPFALARLRVRGRLLEIRAGDLRFSQAEAAQLFKELMLLDLDDNSVFILEQRTEGWVAGLQLAGLSLQGQDSSQVADFVHAFGGSTRFVIDYLVDEVLAKQTPEIRHFLCQTAILDRLSASLCDAITGRNDSKAMLAQLEKANVFLIPLDSRREWYRYHHLFSEVLRIEISPSEQEHLYRQAADWYAVHDSLDQAIEYAFKAKDWQSAVGCMEKVAVEMLQRCELGTLTRWFDALPAPLLHSNWLLTAIKGWVLLMTGQVPAANALLERMAEVEGGVDPLSRGVLFALRAELARVASDNSASQQLAREALALLADAEPFFRLLALRTLGDAQHQSGDSEAASQTWRNAMELGVKLNYPFAALLPLGALIPNLNRQGRRREALTYCERALEQYVDVRGQPLPLVGFLYVPLSMLYYEADVLDKAHEYVQRGLATLKDLRMDRIALGDGEWTLARIQWARGEQEAALATLHSARQAAEEAGLPRTSLLMASLEADFALKSGDLERAATWAEGSQLALDSLPNPSYEMIYLVWARVLLAQKRVEETQVLLGNLKSFAEWGGRKGRLITIYILQALAHGALGNRVVALDRLKSALEIAAPEGYIRPFLDEGLVVARLLPEVRDCAPEFVDLVLNGFAKGDEDSIPKDEGRSQKDEERPISQFANAPIIQTKPSVPHSSSLFDPLTEREIAVLRLIAAGKSNAEIAQALVVSTGTAKWHVHHVIEKLGASNRTQAVARARELGLL